MYHPTSSEEADPKVSIFVNDQLTFEDTRSSIFKKISGSVQPVINVLARTIKSLKLNREYNGTFIAYLSGQLSEEEFLEEAEKYAYEPTAEITEETLREIKILYENTKLEFSPSEIAEIFHLDFDACAEAISNMDLAVAKS